MLDKRSLTTNLGGNLVVRETSSGEERNLLTTSDGVHHIDGRNTSLNHFLRILSLIRVNGLALNVKEVFGENLRSLIDGLAGTIELTTQHLGGDWHAQDITCEFDVSAQVIDIGGAFKDLHNSFLSMNFKNLTLSDRAVTKTDLHNFGVFRELDVLENDKRTFDIEDGSVVDTGCDTVVTLCSLGVDSSGLNDSG